MKYTYTTHIDGLELKDFKTLQQAKKYVSARGEGCVWATKWEFTEEGSLAILWCTYGAGDLNWIYDCSISRKKRRKRDWK